jgi:NADPH:quinone reductase
MKAIVLTEFGGTDNFAMQEVENPILKQGTVKVKISATAFNPIDYQMRRGSSESKYLKSTILGREMSGVIVEVSKSVTQFKIGDEIFGYVSNFGSNGTYAEYIVVPEVIIAHKPKNISFNQAAALSVVGLTAIQTIEKCKIESNDNVFVTGGAGGVGSMVLRLLLKNGIKNIYTTAGNQDSIDKILNYGLPKENIIDYKTENVIEKIFALTKGQKIDFAIDTVGGTLSEICADVLKINSTYADISFLSTEKAREKLFYVGTTIQNIFIYTYGIENDNEKMKYYNNRLTLLKDYLENNLISETPINIVGKFNVETVVKAHYILEKNETKGDKLVMEIPS